MKKLNNNQHSHMQEYKEEGYGFNNHDRHDKDNGHDRHDKYAGHSPGMFRDKF